MGQIDKCPVIIVYQWVEWRIFTMGIYLNPGNASFRGSLRSKIYVDKSGLIAKTNDVICTEQKYVCVREMAIIIV